MIITISGKPGAGKTTVGTKLAEQLDYNLYDVGMLRREMARKRNMTIEEYNKLGETDPSTDLEPDKYQTELAEQEDNFVIQGRVSFYFIPKSLKIFLDVDEMKGAQRIFTDLQNDPEKRNQNKYANVDELIEANKKRIASDSLRYAKYYDGLNIFEKTHYDLWIDTSDKNADQIVEEIIKHIKK